MSGRAVRDDRLRDFLPPVRAVSYANAQNIDALFSESEPQISLKEEFLAVVGGGGHVLLDFGRELHGGIRLSVYTFAGESVRLRLGESVGEASAELGEKHAANDHGLRDVSVRLSDYSDLEFMQSGFRFFRLDVPENCVLKLKSVKAVFVHTPSERIGSFACSDERVNEIFQTAAYTAELCMQTYLWDGIKRDRLVWIGDMYPETAAVLALYGGDPVIKRSLEFEKARRPVPDWMNGFPTYSLWWIIILHELYEKTGDAAYLAAQKDYFIGLLEAIDGRIDENGRFDFGFSFVDWPTHGRADEEEGVRSLCRMAARKAEALAGVLGGGELAGSICRKISRKCLPVNEAKQVAALKYLSGAELSGREKTLLAAGGGKGFSCFLSGQILAALEETAGAEAALDAMKEYFGGMLDMGATAFWEEFDLEWMKNSAPVTAFPRRGETDIHGDFGMHCYKGYRKSLCHGWSAGPVPFLFEKILGIRFLSAGGKELEIRPHLGPLAYAEGTYPTACGKLEVSCRKAGGKTEVFVKAPAEIRVRY